MALVLCASLAPTSAAQTYEAQVWNGREVGVGEYPFVSLLVDNQGDGFCSGSLVSPTVVLTAGHCVHDIPGQPITVRLNGVRAGGTFAEEHTTRVHGAHPRYLRRGASYDFGVILLRRPSAIQPVALARYADEAFWDPGSDVLVVGWGTANSRGDGFGRLREGTTVIRADSRCQNRFGWYDVESDLCVDGWPSSGCPGDSGAPLFWASTDGTYIQSGVVSGGGKTCDEGKVWVAAWVPAGRRWVGLAELEGLPRTRTLTLASAAARISSGDRLKVAAALLRYSDAQRMGYQRLVLERRRAGTTRWRFVSSARTGAAGRATFYDRPNNDMQYRVRHSGTAVTFGSSRKISVTVVR